MSGPFVRAFCVALACASWACRERHEKAAPSGSSAPPTSESAEPAASERAEAAAKSRFVPGSLPVAPFVAEELAKAPANVATLVYVGATWCEPCQRFQRALEDGTLDAELANLRFIEYDHDVSHDALLAAGYRSKFIPLFALPKSDGSASGKQIEGSIKGEGAVADILPRLLELTGRSGPVRR